MKSIYIFDALPGSTEKNPFEIADGAEYFVWRTGGDGLRFTNLCHRDPMEQAMAYYPMGYTNLRLMRRLLLWVEGQILAEAAPEQSPGSKSDKQGDYHVFCSLENINQYFGRKTADGAHLHYGLDTLAEAKAWLANRASRNDERYIIAKQLNDIMWH